MAKELTSGFDIAAQVSQQAVEKVFQTFYWAGDLPNYVKEPYQGASGPATVEIFFGPPELEFVTQVGLSNPVRLTFPFLFRASDKVDEYGGKASVIASTEKSTTIVGAEVAVIITVNFGGLGDELFEFAIDPWTLTSNASEFPPEFDSQIKPILLNSLKATADTIELTPPAAPGAGFFTGKTYDNSFLGIFVNEANVERDPPQSVEPWLQYQGEALRIGIPAVAVNASIKQSLKDMGLDSLPAPMPDDPDVTVNALSIKLKNGYLEVKGDIDDVEFSTTMGLKATASGLETTVGYVDIDMPWYMDIANFFSLGAIQRIMEEEIPKALSGLSTGAFSGMGLFAGKIPGSGVLVNTGLKGFATIRADGLIFSGSVSPVIETDPPPKPTYIKGNKETKEFHRDGCPYGKKLGWKKTRYLIDEVAAIRQGYNGCWTCAREYSHPAGRMIFGFRSTGHQPEEQVEREIAIEGKLMEPMVIDGVEVTDPPFSTQSSLNRKADQNGIWKAFDGLSSYLVQPGLWRFTASSGGWTAECTLQVKPTASNYGATNYVVFSIGKSGGNFGYDETPAFP